MGPLLQWTDDQAPSPPARRTIRLARLPKRHAEITQHGLLYLPHPYVVPGGRFNEMYGWDSYFIALGLLRDGRVTLARQMADNHLYQVRHYGTVLNANRTYYLTRSQPPFLSRMVWQVFEHTRDEAWLRAALPLIPALGRGCGTVLRLPRGEEGATGLPVRHDVFPAVGGDCHAGTGARVARHLPMFEVRGGLLTSTEVTGNQWDAPFGWAPMQLIAVDGLRRYGFEADADRLARRFLALVAKEFGEHRVIVEKYDVVAFDANVSAGIKFGYASNEVGFGWTNAVALELLAGLESRNPRPGRDAR